MSYQRHVKAVTEKVPFGGRDWYYRFRQLPKVFDEKTCAAVALSLLERFSKLTKVWDSHLNAEWLCRLYMSAKLILTASLQVNAIDYSEDRNLRVVIPYLKYYAVLSLLRSICYSLPEVAWSNGAVLRISHAAAVNHAIAHLRKFAAPTANALEAYIRQLKADRELLSYRAPSSGDGVIPEGGDFIGLCTLLAEVAQFNSELLESSLDKHAQGVGFELEQTDIDEFFLVDIDGHVFKDYEDLIRLDYLSRKYSRPANILHMMTEGHVESFYGAWAADQEKETSFDPDEGWTKIFDIP